MSVNNKQFVQAWLKNGGRGEVARRTGLSINQVGSKAMYLRKRGVQLPKMGRHSNEDYSVDYLNNLINKHS